MNTFGKRGDIRPVGDVDLRRGAEAPAPKVLSAREPYLEDRAVRQ